MNGEQIHPADRDYAGHVFKGRGPAADEQRYLLR